MEDVDRKIVMALQENADVTNAALAERVNLSPSSCLRRVQRLKEQGVLARIVALVDPEMAGRDLTAIVDVVFERHGLEAVRPFYEAVAAEKAITQVYEVTGESDMVIIASLTSMKEYQGLCERLFHNNPNVLRYITKFSMDCVKFDTVIPV